MTGVVHHVAQTGFGTGTNELYDKARPSYQAPAISYIRQAVKAPTPLSIVEIGAGTGIFTRALLAHPEWSKDIGRLRAVEPSAGMRDVFVKTVSDERVVAQEGSFDQTGVEAKQTDLVVVAQAFHWCPDFDAAALEFARILKPDGVVALIWNLENRDSAAWIGQVRDRVERYELGTPQFRLGLWRKLFETPSYQKLFQPPIEEVWSYTLDGSIDIVTNRALSKSYIAIQPEDVKSKLRDEIRAVLERGDGKKWVDEDKGIFEYPYKTYVVILRQK